MADVNVGEAAMVVADGNGQEGILLSACYIVAHGILDSLGCGTLHLEVDSIDGSNLSLPKATSGASTKVALQLTHRLDVVDGEDDVVKAEVDGVDSTPDTRA